MARNIQVLRNYFLGKDPMLKETMADNSLRLIGIPGKHFVLRDELIKRLQELQKETHDTDEKMQEQLTALENWKNGSDFVYAGDLYTALSDYYTKEQINELLSVIPTFSIEVVQELPTQDISPTTIYLVPADDPATGNYYNEYLYVNNTWEIVGSTAVDMSNYYTKAEVDAKSFFTPLTEDWTIPENSAMNPLLESGWYYTGDYNVYFGDNIDPVIYNDTFFYYGGGQPEDQWFYLEPVNVADAQNQVDVRLWFDVIENEWKYAGYGITDDIAILKQNPNADLTTAIPTVNATDAEYVSKSGGVMTGDLTTTNLTVGQRTPSSIVGANSVVEGLSNTASGYNSHAEGYSTTAQRRSQHVEGEYNILDTTGADETAKGDYIHIVGNGTADNARSNAHTVDWSGNAWFAGDVYVGSTSGTHRDSGSKKLVTEDDINPAPGDVTRFTPVEWLNISTSTADANGNISYQELTRRDNTLAITRACSNPDVKGNYQTVVETFYKADGITINYTDTYSYTFSSTGAILTKSMTTTEV